MSDDDISPAGPLILIIITWIVIAILANSFTEASVTIRRLEERVERLEHPERFAPSR